MPATSSSHCSPLLSDIFLSKVIDWSHCSEIVTVISSNVSVETICFIGVNTLPYSV